MFFHNLSQPIRLLNSSRWVKELNIIALERVLQHFQNINVDRVARCKDAHVIAGDIHDLIIQNFRGQQDLRSRHQVGEMLDSDTADDENLFGVDGSSLEHQSIDDEIGCSRASSIAHHGHLIHFAEEIGRQSLADELVNGSPLVSTIMDTQSQGMHLSSTRHWHEAYKEGVSIDLAVGISPKESSLFYRCKVLLLFLLFVPID